MKTVVVLVALTAVVSGLPQYHYPRPGGPGRSGGRPTVGGASGNGYNGAAGGTGHGYVKERPGVDTHIPGGHLPGAHVPSGHLPTEHVSTGHTGPAPGEGAGEVGYEEALIHKHVYVHVPPPELEEEPVEQRPISAGRPEKHYKIIFIKAPAPATPAAPVIPAQAAKEEKTLVYVLVKKPEEAAEISVPTPEPTQPSKPEVYFIRYKAAKKEGAGVSSVQEGEGTYPGYQGGEGGEPEIISPPSSYLPPHHHYRPAAPHHHNFSPEHSSTNHQY